MKLTRVPLLVLSIIVLSNCGTSSKISKSVQMQQLAELVSKKSFEIRSEQALPMMTNSLNSLSNAGLFPQGSTAGQVNLIGNTNYLKIMNDSVAAYLPYFGERQMGGGYNRNGAGIQFEGIPEAIEITKDEDKQRYDIRFKMKRDSEAFNVAVTLFPNMGSTINVTSSQRFAIRYNGRVRPIVVK